MRIFSFCLQSCSCFVDFIFCHPYCQKCLYCNMSRDRIWEMRLGPFDRQHNWMPAMWSCLMGRLTVTFHAYIYLKCVHMYLYVYKMELQKKQDTTILCFEIALKWFFLFLLFVYLPGAEWPQLQRNHETRGRQPAVTWEHSRGDCHQGQRAVCLAQPGRWDRLLKECVYLRGKKKKKKCPAGH